ncbi:MAG TPA: DUF4157 domain-containing protein, partial [Chloroflexia bacterium]|nr:DUF4157 domain-containing protein [Chloroflexia bacterium]
MSEGMRTQVAISAPTPSLTPVHTNILQRKCACGGTPGVAGECAECRAKRLATKPQAANVTQTPGVPPVVGEVLRSPGQQMEGATRAVMEPRFGHDFSRVSIHSPAPGAIQAKLTINEPGDRYEQEADALADQVMRMPEPDLQPHEVGATEVRHQSTNETIQRLAAHRDPSLEDAVVGEEEEEEEEEEAGQVQTLRPRSLQSGTEFVSKELLNSSQGGVPLEGQAQRFMETRFGSDFSQVRVHTDRHAETLSNSLSARAFTYGAHIYFGEGEYQPETQEGRRVLAHELTHVIQQGAGQSRLPVQSHVTANPGASGPRTIQRLGSPGRIVRNSVYPWGTGPLGVDREVSTDAGSTVTAWQAAMVYIEPLRSWCHGHSLDSYNNHD